MKSKSNGLMLSLIVAILMVIFKMFFITEDYMEPVADLSNTKTSQMSAKLDMIDFQLEVLDDPKFNSLKSIEMDLIEVPVGRDNPFSPFFN